LSSWLLVSFLVCVWSMPLCFEPTIILIHQHRDKKNKYHEPSFKDCWWRELNFCLSSLSLSNKKNHLIILGQQRLPSIISRPLESYGSKGVWPRVVFATPTQHTTVGT
jgi:hypothetical protein